MRIPILAALPLGVALSWPAAAADGCSLTILNAVPLTVEDNIAWVPATVGTKERQFQIDTAAPDNQMGRDAMTDFGLAAIDFTPQRDAGDAGGFSMGQAATTDIDGTVRGITFGSAIGATGGNAIAIYDAKGNMFHSWADAKPFVLGSMQTDHLQFVVTNLPQPGSGGILSSDFFRKYDIDLNFQAKRFNMFASNHCPGQVLYWRAPGAARLPFHFQKGHIIIRVTVDGQEMDAAIDTGSPRSELEFDDVDSFYYHNSRSPGMTREDDGNLGHNFSILSFGNVAIYHPHLVLTHSLMMRGANSGPQTGTLLRNIDPTAIRPTLTIGTDLLKLLHVYIAFSEHMVYITQGQELAAGDARALPVVAVTPARP